MSSIQSICWDEVPAERFSTSAVGAFGVVTALWPSPVDADDCFAQDGFTRFADLDEQWDREWSRIVQQLIDASLVARVVQPQKSSAPGYSHD
jgi:hypothetical protein